jgi:DNA-directed RNA polymerase subunit RPC12/RpoP
MDRDMAMPYVCAKCGAGLPAGLESGELKCGACGSVLLVRRDEGWRWLAAHEWFVLLAAIIAGVTAYLNS